MTSVSAMKPGLGGRSNPCREIPTELEKYTSYWPDNLNFDHSGTKVLAKMKDRYRYSFNCKIQKHGKFERENDKGTDR